VTLQLTARLASVVDQADYETLLAGLAEHRDGSGWSLTFQGGSPYSEEDTSDEEYCLVTQSGACVYGMVRAVVLHRDQFRLTLTRRAAADLNLPPRIAVALDTDAESVTQFRDSLARIFMSTSIDSRPRRLVLPGSRPPVKGRPLLHRHRRLGTRVEYVIVGTRGVLVDVETVAGPRRRETENPDWLARQLGVEPSTLIGRRYTCRVIKDRDGITSTDFRIVPE
jgi:hypothetical protein